SCGTGPGTATLPTLPLHDALPIFLVAIGGRGVQLCLHPSERTVAAGSTQRYDQVRFRAARGEILDRNGRRLATSVDAPSVIVDRSEEHTSELQSRENLVCRLLLEK